MVGFKERFRELSPQDYILNYKKSANDKITILIYRPSHIKNKIKRFKLF